MPDDPRRISRALLCRSGRDAKYRGLGDVANAAAALKAAADASSIGSDAIGGVPTTFDAFMKLMTVLQGWKGTRASFAMPVLASSILVGYKLMNDAALNAPPPELETLNGVLRSMKEQADATSDQGHKDGGTDAGDGGGGTGTGDKGGGTNAGDGGSSQQPEQADLLQRIDEEGEGEEDDDNINTYIMAALRSNYDTDSLNRLLQKIQNIKMVLSVRDLSQDDVTRILDDSVLPTLLIPLLEFPLRLASNTATFIDRFIMALQQELRVREKAAQRIQAAARARNATSPPSPSVASPSPQPQSADKQASSLPHPPPLLLLRHRLLLLRHRLLLLRHRQAEASLCLSLLPLPRQVEALEGEKADEKIEE